MKAVIERNAFQNDKLIALRDTILPKLMSGNMNFDY